MKNPNEIEDCNFISDVDITLIERLNNCYNKEEIKAGTFQELEEEDAAAAHIAWLGKKQPVRHDKPFEFLDLSNREVKLFVPSVESPHILELKFLPLHLKYVYLGQKYTLPIIISSSSNVDQEKSLLEMLRRYKKAIKWTMANIKGISPSIFMHKILLEGCYSNSIE